MKRSRLSSATRLALLALTLGLLTTHVIATDVSQPSTRFGILRVSVRDRYTGRYLPARVRVVEQVPLGKSSTQHAPRGQLARELAPGTYRVLVTHGPLWSLQEQTVTIAAGEVRTVQAELRRELELSHYTACDLHLHSDASPDSDFSPAERIASVLAEDLGLAVITDHNVVTGIVEELAKVGVIGARGVEVTTWEPEFGHFNAFPVQRRPPYKRTTEAELLRALAAEGDPFVQINHPRLEHHIGYFALRRFDRDDRTSAIPLGFHAIEVWNGYELSSPRARDETFHDWLALVQRGARVVATGGSDSHKRGRSPFAGYPRTYVRSGGAARPDLAGALRALKRGAAFVTNGPFVELRAHAAQSGDELVLPRAQRSLDVDVEVGGPAWMELAEVELWAGTERVAALAVAPSLQGATSHVRARIEVPADARSLVATARGTGSMERLLGDTRSRPYAFTNPIWLERR